MKPQAPVAPPTHAVFRQLRRNNHDNDKNNSNTATRFAPNLYFFVFILYLFTFCSQLLPLFF